MANAVDFFDRAAHSGCYGRSQQKSTILVCVLEDIVMPFPYAQTTFVNAPLFPVVFSVVCDQCLCIFLPLQNICVVICLLIKRYQLSYLIKFYRRKCSEHVVICRRRRPYLKRSRPITSHSKATRKAPSNSFDFVIIVVK